jgi:glycosyltransferase involved in cell wall biosynthesis
MVHDISYLTHPEWLSGRDALMLRLGVARSVARAARVVVPTETIRGQVIETYGVDAARVHAIAHGPGAAAQKLSIEEARRVLTHLGADSAPPYLLVVGGATPRKNLVALVEAFGEVRDFAGDLVLAGAASGRQAAEVARAARRLAGRVVITHHLRDREVAALYQQARAVAVPSLHEGFGLTALEAMWHGIPVAASHDPALREVCGESATYFDPSDRDSMAAALATVLLDETERARLISGGPLRAGRFTWERSAAAHAEVYRLAADVGAQ